PATLAAIASELISRDLGSYNGQGRAPETAAKRDMLDAGASKVQQFLVAHSDAPQLAGPVVAIDDLLAWIPPEKFGNSQNPQLVLGKILRAKFKGWPLGQHRRPGGRASFWAIDNRNRLPDELMQRCRQANEAQRADAKAEAVRDFYKPETSAEAEASSA